MRDAAGKPRRLRELPEAAVRGYFAKFVGFIVRDGGLIDTLTVRDPQTRELVRIAIEDADARARVERAAELLPDLPRTEADAMRLMLKDRDAAVAAIAAEHALELPGTTESQRERPSLEALSQRFFGPISLRNEPSGA